MLGHLPLSGCLRLLQGGNGDFRRVPGFFSRVGYSTIGFLSAALLLIASTGCGGSAAAPAQQITQSDPPPPPAQHHTTVATYHNDNARTGANTSETTLTPFNVDVVSFGKLAAITVEGDVYGQPLYIPGVVTANSITRNLVIVATEHDQVYAIDADKHAIVWHTDFLGSSGNVTPVPSADTSCNAINPEIGITGTPVIDTAGSTIYLVARTEETQGGEPAYYQRIHALDLATGQDKVAPVAISTPDDPGGQFGVAKFDPLLNNQRAALLLANGQVYVSWASQCDVGDYQGWVMAFDAGTLQLTSAWTPSPSGMLGGIWMAGGGPASDASGDVYLAVGNGWSDAGSGGTNYGDSVVRLRNSGSQLSVVDYFMPYDWQKLMDDDLDLGSGGPVLLPDQTGTHAHLLTVAGKDGTVYLLDRDGLGQWQVGNDGQIVQSFKSDTQYSLCTPAFWNNNVYFGWMMGPVEAFHFDPSTQQLSTVPTSTSGAFNAGYPGSTPSVSANGTANGVVWVLRNNGTHAELRAMNANNLATAIYDSEMSPARDEAGPSVVFGVPTIADGLVFVGDAAKSTFTDCCSADALVRT